MTTKRASLASALQSVSRQPEPHAAQARATVPEVQAAAAEGSRRQTRPMSRVGKKTIAAHFDPAASKQLKQIGLERDRSVQDLLREAINDLFEKYGKAPIA